MALLFDRDVKTMAKHTNTVFKEGELDENAVVAKFATTTKDGKVYRVELKRKSNEIIALLLTTLLFLCKSCLPFVYETFHLVSSAHPRDYLEKRFLPNCWGIP